MSVNPAPPRRAPWRWLAGTGVCGFCAFAILVALAVLVGKDEVSLGLVVGLSTLLLLCLLGFFGCAGATLWRLLERR